MPQTNPTDAHAINRQILALAVPTFGQLIAEPAFVLIDTAIVGHIGDTALAGLSIGSTILLTVVGLCVFLAYSTTSQVGHLIGAGCRREGLEAGIDGLWLALIIGSVASLVIFLAAEPLCWAMGARGDVLDNATAYLQAVVFGMPGMMLVYAANGIFRGLQKVRITLAAAVCGAVVNTVLDVLFVFGFDWGVTGSGVATLIAQWFMGLFLVVPALLWARADGADWRPRLRGILGSASDGSVLFIRSLALRACMVATVMAATSMGTQVLAAYQSVNSCWNFVINILDAIGIAGQALVAAELGAGHRDRARLMTRAAGRSGLIGGVAIGVGPDRGRIRCRAAVLLDTRRATTHHSRHDGIGDIPAVGRMDVGRGRHPDRRGRLPLSGGRLRGHGGGLSAGVVGAPSGRRRVSHQ